MIAVLNKDFHPLYPPPSPSASQLARRTRKQNRLAGLALKRAANLAAAGPNTLPAKGTFSNRSLQQSDGERLARERKARKKAERLARRPRKVVVEDVRKSGKVVTVVVGGPR